VKPFIHVIGPSIHTDEVWGGAGVQPKERTGAHAMFAARVPFIPSFLSDDFVRMVASEMGRVRLIAGRQIRFINDLASARDLPNSQNHAATFNLRFIAHPREDRDGSDIEILFLAKVFNENRRAAIRLAEVLWKKFRAHFPLEDPFNYPLIPVTDQDDFERCLTPIPLEAIQPGNLMEVRKFEDCDPMMGNDALGYFPHPFSPVLDYSAMGRFLETLAGQEQLCVASISLQPTCLFHDELVSINRMLNQYRGLWESAERAEGYLAPYRKERFDDLWRTYEPLINQRNHLFCIVIQVIGEHEAPVDLVDALGSEFMNNSTPEPRRWSRTSPSNGRELQIARDNFGTLEHKIWSKPEIAPWTRRLPFLVTAYEAAGAFRLPIPPESGYMPGVVIKDEPFVLPSEATVSRVASGPVTEEKLGGQDLKAVSLGEIIHRGTPTGVDFTLSVEDLKRHALVAGATGSGKTNTCLHILSHLWVDYGIPFLVLYPIDKPDYRLLMADPGVREKLLIFTVGDETTAPFRFNPFHVPAGILLKTHMSQLMRSFLAAFSMWDPLPAVYREALREVYRDRGWNLITGKGGDPGVTTPTVSDFYDAIVQVSQRLTQGYRQDVQGNIRQGSEIRIRDLLQNAGSIINVEEQAPLSMILSRPTVMELGRIGSSEDIALIMGFLLTILTEQLQSEQKDIPQDKRDRLHVTLIEEAHRLMSAGHFGTQFQADPRSRGGEDFSNILAEVRGFGESILIAEQIPTNLVQGAIGNTHVKVMHWLEDAASFDLFNDILSLNERQREYARTLEVGHAVMRSKSGRPVHVKVKNYLDDFQDEMTDAPLIDFVLPDGTHIQDETDDSLRAFMAGRIRIPKARPWDPTERVVRRWGERACEFCRVPCRYGDSVGRITWPTGPIKAIGAAAQNRDWPRVHSLSLDAVRQAGLEPTSDAAYCYFARLARDETRDGRSNREAYPYVQDALRAFHSTVDEGPSLDKP
jgi:hypothetical protein